MSKKHYIIPIFISHIGCPHQCVFCNQDKIAKEVEKEVTGEDVRNTIEEYLSTIDYKNSTVEVSFFGGTFTAIDVKKQKELLEVAKEYKEKGYIKKIRMSTRPDAINRYILDYLKDYKVDIIELGVQSLDDEILRLSGRGHSAEDVEKASKLIKEYKFVLGHQIMPGLPGDNFEKDIETAKKSIAMKPDICRIYPSLVIKDTPMEIMYNRGEYKPYTLEEAIEISKQLYRLYISANVNIIRIGLQPTENITWGKDLVDGPFHPSFRELVEGSIICDNIKNIINKDEDVIVEINSKDLSKLYANKKCFFNKLKSSHNGSISVSIKDSIKRGKIRIVIVKRTDEINIR
ncbi:MAG: radical SAM protein [Clostridium sp.]|nr:radical SAM protein [Clostridium sp.]